MTGQIITFYSPTGGAYRAIALVNLAWALASTGKRVLLVDWDLERPVLHLHLRRLLVDGELACSEGLVDMLLAFMDAALTPLAPAEKPSEGWHEEYADARPYTCGVTHEFLNSRGYLGLLPAGKLDTGRLRSAYERTVSTFDWRRFYAAYGGGTFLESMKAQLRAEYDYVLINGGAGSGDVVGPPVVQMPDVLAVFHADDEQGRAALGATEGSVIRQRGDSCRVIAVANKVDFHPRHVRADPPAEQWTNLVEAGDISRLVAAAAEASS